MKDFLKENIAIAAAIALPLLLVVIFMMSTTITNITVDDPKHDFLIATEYYHNDNDSLRFDIVQNRLKVTYRYPWKNEHNHYMYNKDARLWRVHVNDMSVEEISLPLPHDKNADNKKISVELDVPDIESLKVINKQPGPDGYIFENSSRRYRGNIMTELFSYDYHYSGAGISNNGRFIPIKGHRENQYRYNTRFIGWILEEE